MPADTSSVLAYGQIADSPGWVRTGTSTFGIVTIPLAVARGDVHGGMQVEAGLVRVERHVALDPGRVGVRADPHGPPPRARAERGPAEDRRPGEARQRRRLVREWIGVLVGARRRRHAEALEPAPHPRDDAMHVVVRGRRRRMEAQRAVPLAHEDAVEDERVKVEVHVHGSAEALHARHHTGLSARQPLTPRLAAIGAAHPAAEEFSELVHDEPGQATAIRLLRRRGNR